MQLKIEVEISEEQIKAMKESGEFVIELSSDNVVLDCGYLRDAWPDPSGNKYAEFVIEKLKASRLLYDHIKGVSVYRVQHIIKDMTGKLGSIRIVESIERSLGLKFENKFGAEKLEWLKHFSLDDQEIDALRWNLGVVTLRDFETLTMDDVKAVPGLSESTIRKIEDVFTILYEPTKWRKRHETQNNN